MNLFCYMLMNFYYMSINFLYTSLMCSQGLNFYHMVRIILNGMLLLSTKIADICCDSIECVQRFGLHLVSTTDIECIL